MCGFEKRMVNIFSCIRHSTFLKVESRSWRSVGGRKRGGRTVSEEKLYTLQKCHKETHHFVQLIHANQRKFLSFPSGF